MPLCNKTLFSREHMDSWRRGGRTRDDGIGRGDRRNDVLHNALRQRPRDAFYLELFGPCESDVVQPLNVLRVIGIELCVCERNFGTLFGHCDRFYAHLLSPVAILLRMPILYNAQEVGVYLRSCRLGTRWACLAYRGSTHSMTLSWAR
jgi:hypothetical protein